LKDEKLIKKFEKKLRADIFFLGCYAFRPNIEKIGEKLDMPFRMYDGYNKLGIYAMKAFRVQ